MANLGPEFFAKGEAEFGFRFYQQDWPSIRNLPEPRTETILPRSGHPLRLTLRFLFCRKTKFDGGSQRFL
jgi:hypothetical protein